MIAVFHNRKNQYMTFEQAKTYVPCAEDLVLVAWVETDSWDAAYDRTNHHDPSGARWTEGEGVEVAARNPNGTYDPFQGDVRSLPCPRSTHIGDVFLKGDGTAVVVCPIGFAPVTCAPLLATLLPQAFMIMDTDALQAYFEDRITLDELQQYQNAVEATLVKIQSGGATCHAA